ncbi:MAG: bifunctional demethylmenaquinone methyltransferase/2-methoxy-6-polyprenyl-1,4-benzoquinol methylase UbiE [Gammaproteobacteria bacterium]|jgi:demethylmenaquinone methyltransferase/2-methoxy-6-polyprenyl-1,4-benzoquinol methylase
MSDDKNKVTLTDFGFASVPWDEKKSRVRAVFDSVAERYDVMNDVMSFGLHRIWKRFVVAKSGLRSGQQALDVAAGSGDISLGLLRRVGPTGRVIVTDINAKMLRRGRDRLINAGMVGNVEYAESDAENLPFKAKVFNCVTIGFGLRNLTDKGLALRSMWRVLKPGGRVLVLEFSRPNFGPLMPLYDMYSFQVLPRLGQLLVNDATSYQYLAESIRKHPDQEQLKTLMMEQGFERCRYYNLSGGIVSVHVGFRL